MSVKRELPAVLCTFPCLQTLMSITQSKLYKYASNRHYCPFINVYSRFKLSHSIASQKFTLIIDFSVTKTSKGTLTLILLIQPRWPEITKRCLLDPEN